MTHARRGSCNSWMRSYLCVYIYNIYKSTDGPQHACIYNARLKVANFHLGEQGGGRRDQFWGTLPKSRDEGEEILCWVLLCVTRATTSSYTYIQLSAGLSAPHTPYASRFIKDPAKFSLSFFFVFIFLLFVWRRCSVRVYAAALGVTSCPTNLHPLYIPAAAAVGGGGGGGPADICP